MCDLGGLPQFSTNISDIFCPNERSLVKVPLKRVIFQWFISCCLYSKGKHQKSVQIVLSTSILILFFCFQLFPRQRQGIHPLSSSIYGRGKQREPEFFYKTYIFQLHSFKFSVILRGVCEKKLPSFLEEMDKNDHFYPKTRFSVSLPSTADLGKMGSGVTS